MDSIQICIIVYSFVIVCMYMLLHERECNIVYVARGIDVDPRAT